MVGAGLIVTLTLLSSIVIIALSVLGWIQFQNYIAIPIAIVVVGIAASGIRIIRPTSKGVIERLGKFQRVQGAGWTWIIPGFERLYGVNITEQMTDAEKQEIITKDKLNATVAALIRYKVMADDESVKKSQYQVNNYENQIIQLARTTLRNVIGTKDFSEVNSERDTLNTKLRELIGNETNKWGIEIVNFELKEIEPPKDVQDTMNSVIMANNKKVAAIDLAEAVKTQAAGEKLASIERAEGQKRSLELNAEGQAKATIAIAEAEAKKTILIADAEAKKIEVVNTAATKYFKDGAVEMRKLEVTENALSKNSKVILTERGISPSIIVNEGDGTVVPAKRAD